MNSNLKTTVPVYSDVGGIHSTATNCLSLCHLCVAAFFDYNIYVCT
jgi:hypothetical protein